MELTIAKLQQMRESEDHVEFKKGEGGNVSYNGGDKKDPKDRRRCILGYVIALCNENGGHLVIGMHDDYPHKVVGTKQCENAIGELESNIYRDTGIRTKVYELFDDNKLRVLVIQVPSRPYGKVYKFEDIPLMRVGEDLKPMDDKTYFSIIQEQEPDFSERICRQVTFNDLDGEAITILKQLYAKKQHNPDFALLSDIQALRDLRLVIGDEITNAAVLLVGRETIINEFFPHAKVIIEYRETESQITFNKRIVFGQPFYKLIDLVWSLINEKNSYMPIQEGPYMFDIPYFNESVTREIINNAFTHRDYSINSEIVVKLYPARIDVVNSGGFPKGVSLDNLLSIPSTTRNRLISDVLSKTGVVERSGQGMDKIFFTTLREGKMEPDYSRSDDYHVMLTLNCAVKDPGFAIYFHTIQNSLPDSEKLTVFDIVALNKIKNGEKDGIDKTILNKLLNKGFIEKHGNTNALRYNLSKSYYELSSKIDNYYKLKEWDTNRLMDVLVPYLKKNTTAHKSDILNLVGNNVTIKQLRKLLDQLKELGLIKTQGEKRCTVYMFGDNFNMKDR